jgi:hypothetical protein
LRAPEIAAETGAAPMSWLLIAAGLVGAAMLALGFGLIVPLGGGIAGLCDLAGIASAMVFIGLIDGQ